MSRQDDYLKIILRDLLKKKEIFYTFKSVFKLQK